MTDLLSCVLGAIIYEYLKVNHAKREVFCEWVITFASPALSLSLLHPNCLLVCVMTLQHFFLNKMLVNEIAVALASRVCNIRK